MTTKNLQTTCNKFSAHFVSICLLFFRDCKTVLQWNTERANWKNTFSQQELNWLDSSGFIVDVLGKDSI